MSVKPETLIQLLLEYVGLNFRGRVKLNSTKVSQSNHTTVITLIGSCAKNLVTVQITAVGLPLSLSNLDSLSQSSSNSNPSTSAPSQLTHSGTPGSKNNSGDTEF